MIHRNKADNVDHRTDHWKMERNRQRAALRAGTWLAGLELPPEDATKHLQRLLAIEAAKRISLNPGLTKTFARLASRLPELKLSTFDGDPALAMMVLVTLRAHQIPNAGLGQLAGAYGSVLNEYEPSPGAELTLMAYLCRRCGHPVSEPALSRGTVATASQLMIATREQILERCRLLAMVTAFGRRETDVGDLLVVLSLRFV